MQFPTPYDDPTGFPGNGANNTADDQYLRGRCIAMLGFAMSEPIPSPTTVVGSRMVATDEPPHTRSSAMVECDSLRLCPRSLAPASDASTRTWRVNPAPVYMMEVAFNAIDKRSLRKQEAWQFLSFMMNDE